MNKNKIRLYLDMDGTLAEFKRVSSEDELYMAGFFQNLQPHTNVLDGVCDLKQRNSHIEIYTLSAFLSDSKHALKEKNIWLDTYLPEIKKENRIFTPCGTAKHNSVREIGKTDILLDDYNLNLEEWRKAGGTSIKLVNDMNDRGNDGPLWNGSRIRYDFSSERICLELMDTIKNIFKQ